MKIRSVLIVLLLGLVCGVYSQYANSEEYFTGSGIGENAQEAKQQALKNLASSVLVTVNSEISETIATTNDEAMRQTYSQIVITADDIVLADVSWTQLNRTDGMQEYQARVAKQALAKHYAFILSDKMAKVERNLGSASSNVASYIAVNSEMSDLFKQMPMFSAVKEYAPELTTSLSQYSQLADDYSQLAKGICFNIEYIGFSNFEKKQLLPLVSSQIKTDGIRFSDSDSGCFVVTLNSNTQTYIENYQKKITVNLTVAIGEPAINEVMFNFKGVGKTKKRAMNDAKDRFKQYYENQNLWRDLLTQQSQSIEI